MCHLILLMPVLALPIFWLLPPGLSIPAYAIIVAVTALLYRLIARSMGRQPETGKEGLIGVAGEVVSRLGPANHAHYLVRSQGELWSASSPDVPQTGERVNVAAVDGIRLVVRPNGRHVTLAEEAVKKSNERHCH
jgi:membrane protein implicated in regulation of membrane protease activity